MQQRQPAVRRAADRFRTVTEQTDTWHSFSFGEHYDPSNVAFGALLANNEDRVRAGGGYESHRHAETEIVTWVLSGSLDHADSAGHRATVRRGVAQRLSAGSGIDHAERAGDGGPVHFVQMWLRPDAYGIEPSYQSAEVALDGLDRDWVPVASGHDHRAALELGSAATLWITRLGPGESRQLPAGERRHLFVAAGAVELSGAGRLDSGDAARLSSDDDLMITGFERAELLLWELAR